MRLFIFVLFLAGTLPLPAAELPPKTELQSAIKRLAAQPNYSWTATLKSQEGAIRQGPTEGNAQRNGYVYFKLPVGDDEIEAAFLGSKGAIKTEGQWLSAAELQGDREWIARRLNTFKPPAGEAEDLLARSGFVRKEKDGSFAADLTTNGAKELLALRSRSGDISSVSGRIRGSVKFWIKDGLLSSYEFSLQGKVGGPDQKPLDVNRTVAVEIKNVGSTTFTLPDEARQKL